MKAYSHIAACQKTLQTAAFTCCDRARDFPVLYCVVSYDAHPLHENGPSIQLCEFHVKQAFKVEVGNSGQSAE